MTARVDIDAVRKNMQAMIDVLEYDSSRSSGKAKMNSQHLHSLYFLLDRYEEQEKKAAKKPAKSGV